MTVTYGAFAGDMLACRALELLAAEEIPTVLLSADTAPPLELIVVFTCDGPYHNRGVYSRFLSEEDCAPGSRYRIPAAIASLPARKLALRPWSTSTTEAPRLAGLRASLLHVHARLTGDNLLRVRRPSGGNAHGWRRRTRDERPLAL